MTSAMMQKRPNRKAFKKISFYDDIIIVQKIPNIEIILMINCYYFFGKINTKHFGHMYMLIFQTL